MKKQFFRVKQLADQAFLGADRSEGLNHDELKKADNKVEYISKVFKEIIKHLPTSVSTGEEKRKKKYYEYTLGSLMLELAHDENDRHNELLQYILKECGNTELHLAEDQANYDLQVEQYVSAPINVILEKELPNIGKLKRNLSKYVLDKDATTSRYQNATKNGIPKENLKEDMDEADIKVDQSRDALATEMFGLSRKENEMSMYLLQFLKMQRSYHESALNTLQNIIPVLEQKIGESEVKPIFGCDLEEHLKVSRRRIAFPLEVCVLALSELGMSEEGLFRVGGGASRVKRLRLSIDSGCFSIPLIHEYRDVHVLASTLKSYLRELPEPLLTFDLYDEWMESMKYAEDQRLLVVQEILKKLPQANKDNLAFLIHFLAKLSKHPENKMTSSNIAIVMSPNLLWSTKEELNMHMKSCATINMIVELFINNVDVLFSSDLMNCTTIKVHDIIEVDVFHRPEIQSLKANHINLEHHENLSSDVASPKPYLRKKAKPAPAPPNVKADIEYLPEMKQENLSSYPSGSSTLNRSHKIRSSENSRLRPKVEDDEDESASARRSSLVLDEKAAHTKVDLPNSNLVNLDNTKTVDYKQVHTQSTVLSAKSKPVQHVTAQITNVEVPVVTNNLQKAVNIPVDYIVKPVAAPRASILLESEKNKEGAKKDVMSKSLNSIDVDGESIQTRREVKDELEKPNKPAIPVRPASLRTALPRSFGEADKLVLTRNCGEADLAIQKTQCSVYNTAHTQQPSIVNIHNRSFRAGHDYQISEKEKFLGHQPSAKPKIENQFSDINFNCDKTSVSRPEVPSKPPLVKSSEKLNCEPIEKVNGNSRASHNRTRSDGNIVDIITDGITPTTLLQTPPSPRSLNKPSQPPPPPPVAKTKVEAENTN